MGQPMESAVKPTVKVLACNCGDCTHWEIFQKEGMSHMVCKTCDEHHRISLDFPDHESLKWVDREKE